jgi:hypothetical protein
MIDYSHAMNAIDDARSACGKLEDALGWISQAEEEEGDADYAFALTEINDALSDFDNASNDVSSAVGQIVGELDA